jgi:hypothetical protein
MTRSLAKLIAPTCSSHQSTLKGGDDWGAGHWSELTDGNGIMAALHAGMPAISDYSEAR